MKPIEMTMISLNAALYAVIGYLTFLGIFTPIIGIVRFWGIAVVVPAVFAVLFGPFVGGIGAAIGIFISDMIIHGNALLSLTVGVPANFVMFYLIGLISQTKYKIKFPQSTTILGSLAIALIFLLYWFIEQSSGYYMASIFLIFGTLCVLILLLIERYWPEWKKFAFASIIGNMIGSAIVGLGVWAFSQFFILPGNLGSNLSIIYIMIWFGWTFINQMPFLLILCPPILRVCYRIFPKIVS